MHAQLLHPDTVTPFRSHQEVLARLLPYHIWAEPEPPPAAIEKGRFSRGSAACLSLLVGVTSFSPADAVFESVASVLLSRSRGLMARFQQMTAKDEKVLYFALIHLSLVSRCFQAL